LPREVGTQFSLHQREREVDACRILVWTFSSSEAGTLLTTEESWERPALPSDVGALQQALDTLLTRWLSSLKAHVADPGLLHYRQAA